MHPYIASQIIRERHKDLLAAAGRQRLKRESARESSARQGPWTRALGSALRIRPVLRSPLRPAASGQSHPR
jgi:hypothetical protein